MRTSLGLNIQAKNLKRSIGIIIIIGNGFKKRNQAITFFLLIVNISNTSRSK